MARKVERTGYEPGNGSRHVLFTPFFVSPGDLHLVSGTSLHHLVVCAIECQQNGPNLPFLTDPVEAPDPLQHRVGAPGDVHKQHGAAIILEIHGGGGGPGGRDEDLDRIGGIVEPVDDMLAFGERVLGTDAQHVEPNVGEEHGREP